MTPAGFPHSEILGSQLGCQLPEAYRRLLRPSSAPGAKAFTVCPRQLDHKDARVHCAILKQRPTSVYPAAIQPNDRLRSETDLDFPKPQAELVSSGPNRVFIAGPSRT